MKIIIEGIVIGVLVSLPIGPLGIITMQKTINTGWKIGFLSGLGAALSDLVYSSAAVFGISFIDNFIHEHENLINCITGILFCIVGMNIIINAFKKKDVKENEKRAGLHPTLSTFLIGFSNPLTFLIFLTLFALLSVQINTLNIIYNFILVGSIFGGAIAFWLLICKFMNHSKNKFSIETIYQINKVLGIMLIIFGFYSITLGLLSDFVPTFSFV